MPVAADPTQSKRLHSSRLRAAAPALLMVLLTLVAYGPAMRAGYIWDDPDYLTENPHVQSPDGIIKVWLPRTTHQYYPLVFTTFWIEYHLWGLHPVGYHLTNILLQAANAVLVWLILRRLRVPAAWLCAAVFALHPVHVESVAWITERKNVLSGLFYLLSMWCFLRFEDEHADKWYYRSLLFYPLALLSKTVTCSLPLALLLIRWYRQGRWSRSMLRDLLPFFVVGIGLGLFTVYMERYNVGAQGEDFDLSVAQRTLIAGRALWFYAYTLLFPANLMFIYPRWEPDPASLLQWLAPAAVVLVVVALWLARNRIGRGPLAAALFFILTLSPALGFINVYPFVFSFVADHFQYLASLGFIALVIGGLARPFVATSSPLGKNLGRAAATITLVFLAALTWNQAKAYRDEETLWRHTLARNPNAWMPHFNLGLILDRRGDADEAHKHYLEVVHLRPQHHKAQTLLARDYMNAGDLDRAIEHANAALAIDPTLLTPHMYLGHIYAARADYDLAARHYAAARAAESPQPDADPELLRTLEAMGEFVAAAGQLLAAEDGRGEEAPARGRLGLALFHLGQLEPAVRELQKAVDADPALIDERVALALALAELGRYGDALTNAREARSLAGAENHALVQQLDEMIAAFQTGQPYRPPSALPPEH